MKTENFNSDPKLTSLLSEVHITTPLPPRFQEHVWRRIARAESQGGHGWWRRILDRVEAAFRRPAPAACYIAVLLFLGLTAGYRQAQEKSAHAESQWRARYVASVDPYLKPRN